MVQSSAENLEHTGPVEKERVVLVPQREQLASTPEPPLPKGKATEPFVQRWERVRVSESGALARERKIKVGVWRGKGALQSEGKLVPRR